MNKLLIAIAALVAQFALVASPSATQQWVKEYVSTNSTPGIATNAVTEAWVMEWVSRYVQTNVVSTASSESTYPMRVRNAVAMAFINASESGLYALSFMYKASSNKYRSVKLATADCGGWTNVVYECGVATNQNYEAVLTVDEIAYNCSTFSNYMAQNKFTRIVGNDTNVINVVYASITTNDYKTARGEN